MAKRTKGPVELVEPRMQETVISWYRGAKIIEVQTTCRSDMCLFERKGWKPVEGKEGKAALPYRIYRVPRKALTVRAASSVARKRPGPPRRKS